jgi:hypothetical protein
MFRVRSAVLVLVLAALLSACSGVPTASEPQVIRPVDVVGEQTSDQDVAPEVGANPRSIVSGFLHASASAASGHSAARQFLTAEARRLWQDNPTYLVDDFRVQLPDILGNVATIIVNAHKIGSIDSHGQYSPRLEGNGVGALESFPFKMRRVDGEWRISELQPGVLVRRADFESIFRPRPLYFLDVSEQHLVPDLRYSSLEGQQLATWLLAQLIAGPRPELGSAVVNEIPEQLDPRRVTVTVGDQIKVEIPGSSGIDPQPLRRLAAELAYTFGPIQFSAAVQLTDGGAPVNVPGFGTQFLASQFESTLGSSSLTDPKVYYICGGGVCDNEAKPLNGQVGTNRYRLSAVAVHDPGDGNPRILGLSGSSVFSGSVGAGLVRVTMPRAEVFARPSWQPYTDNVWLAGGHNIYMVSSNGAVQTIAVSETEKQSALGPGSIIALRFSPDGARLAFVLAAPDGTRTVYVGTVVRSGAQVRVESADAVTPPMLLVDDVDWSNSTSLVLVGREQGTGSEGDTSVWTMQSDGSLLRGQTAPAGLPAAPQAIAAATSQFTVVSAGGAIWVQHADSWVSLDGSGTTQGENPTYSE